MYVWGCRQVNTAMHVSWGLRAEDMGVRLSECLREGPHIMSRSMHGLGSIYGSAEWCAFGV